MKKQVKALLGLANYYRKFVPSLSEIDGTAAQTY